MTGDGRKEWYESSRQRTLILTFDTVEAAQTWDALGDMQVLALLADPSVAHVEKAEP